MLRKIQKKLHSETGASLLLTLLFFLISILVTASILMAASSNAGKIRSNREEHQAYLGLSSALQLVADDLKDMTYTGQYTCTVTTWTETVGTGDEEEQIEHTKKETKQIPGNITGSQIGPQLVDDFDYIFGQQMRTDIAKLAGDAEENTTIDAADILSLTDPQLTPHTLTVTPPQTDGLKDRKVNITLQTDSDTYSIYLTAVYQDTAYSKYQMRAELAPTANKTGVTALPNDEGVHNLESGSMIWKLGWITK